MKKSVLWLLIIALFFGVLSGCVNPAQQGEADQTAAPTETADPQKEIAEAEIQTGKHEREDGYPNPFKTHFIDTPYAAVHLMDGEAYSDERLRALAGIVVSDVLQIDAVTGDPLNKVTVYAVWNLLQDRPILLGDHMICSAEQVENGSYREALCGVCCDLSIPWKQAGLSEIVFGSPDESGLKEFYADEAHALTASCAAVYFLPEIAGEETAEAARKTAVSMTAYLIGKGGLDALRAVVSTAEVLPDWTAHIGIETPITLPDGHERAGTMIAYRDKTPKRICVLEIGNITLRVNKGGPLETAEELYAFSCKLMYGFDFELAEIRKESSIFAETADRSASGVIVITLSDDPTQSGISTGSRQEITLVRPYVVWHELIHALLWTTGSNSLAWMQEGLAEHFSRNAASLAVRSPESETFEDWLPDYAEMNEDELAFYKTLWRVYLAVREENEAVPAELSDDWAFRRALGLCELFLPYDPYEGSKYASVGGTRGAKTGDQTEDGDALSYEEAMVLLEYLFDTYGTDTIADCMMNNRTLSETCGRDYPELYQDCLAYLQETYGHLLNAD